jgi:ribosomal protein S18 acetylase RimI-like enzyme
MTGDCIKVTVDPDEAAVERLGSQLRAYNRSRAPQEPPRRLLLSIEDDAGELIAGLYGYLSYSWLFVEVLWVAEKSRKCGHGTRLLDQAEEFAREHGCHSAWLDTFSFQGPGFYEKQGYTLFGELPNYPGEHRRFFLWKRLN